MQRGEQRAREEDIWTVASRQLDGRPERRATSDQEEYIILQIGMACHVHNNWRQSEAFTAMPNRNL